MLVLPRKGGINKCFTFKVKVAKAQFKMSPLEVRVLHSKWDLNEYSVKVKDLLHM